MKVFDLTLGSILLTLGFWRIVQTLAMNLKYQTLIALIYFGLGVLPGLALFINGFKEDQ